MRVRFLRNWQHTGDVLHVAGEVIDLDEGIAARALADDAAEEFPRMVEETIAAINNAWYPGDEGRTPAQIRFRRNELRRMHGLPPEDA